MTLIRRELFVPYTPAQMYDLVDDIEHYSDFLPWCASTDVLSRNDDEVRATLQLSWHGIDKSFTTCNRMQKDKMIEVRLISGPFKRLEGFWMFESGEGGCQVVLNLEFEMAGGMFSFALGPIFSQVATTLVDAFATRAAAVYGAK
jgi:ribosome-associated toxin RatA of RatAB toxin-antitoxin module